MHASLQVEALQNCATVRDARQVLDRFPTKIEDIYSETMGRIEQQSKNYASIARTILLWVTFAERPLTVTELQRVAAIRPDTLKFDPEGIVPEALLVSVCCGLVVVDKKTRLVRLIRTSYYRYDAALST